MKDFLKKTLERKFRGITPINSHTLKVNIFRRSQKQRGTKQSLNGFLLSKLQFSIDLLENFPHNFKHIFLRNGVQNNATCFLEVSPETKVSLATTTHFSTIKRLLILCHELILGSLQPKET